jgi:hypothetical protein
VWAPGALNSIKWWFSARAVECMELLVRAGCDTAVLRHGGTGGDHAPESTGGHAGRARREDLDGGHAAVLHSARICSTTFIGAIGERCIGTIGIVYPGTLFHRRQRGIPMHSYENRGQIRALVLQRLALCVAGPLHRPHKAQLHSFVGIQSATHPSFLTVHTPCGSHYYMYII